MSSVHDMNAAKESYLGFTTIVKWAAISSAVTVMIVVLLIA